MKIIKIKEWSFEQSKDPVATEETVSKKLNNIIEELSDDFNYVELPICWLLNNKGVEFTQQVLDQIEERIKDTKIYVCQHILVNRLNFHDNVVYTPHATSKDNFRVIPHYNPCVEKHNYIPVENRKYHFSFMGSFHTHSLRPQLQRVSGKGVLIENTGQWHFQKKDREQQTKRYVDVLCDTKFALCPPGTGPSTIRLYEAMAAGCVPVVFNDVKIPEVMDPYVVRITTIDELVNLTQGCIDINYMKIHELYWRYLSNDVYYQLIHK